MKIHFQKMSGAGNDFIVLDGSRLPPELDWPTIAIRVCNRRNGIGADGLIVIRDHPLYDASMAYYNADGSSGSMCGNGGRCVARYVMARTGRKYSRFEAVGETYEATLLAGGAVRLSVPKPSGILLDQTLRIDGEHLAYHFVDSGSPHAVLFQELLPPAFRNEIQATGVNRLGALVRRHEAFAPGGTNVNFIREAQGFVYQRTYERGVEDETLACGTGAIAVAAIAVLKAGYAWPVTVRTRGGEDLVVSQAPDGSRLYLEGGAVFVFEGDLEID